MFLLGQVYVAGFDLSRPSQGSERERGRAVSFVLRRREEEEVVAISSSQYLAHVYTA